MWIVYDDKTVADQSERERNTCAIERIMLKKQASDIGRECEPHPYKPDLKRLSISATKAIPGKSSQQQVRSRKHLDLTSFHKQHSPVNSKQSAPEPVLPKFKPEHEPADRATLQAADPHRAEAKQPTSRRLGAASDQLNMIANSDSPAQ